MNALGFFSRWLLPRGRRPKRGCIVAALAGIFALSAVSAQTVNWTGNTNTDWNTGSNWSSGVVPVSGNTVILDTNSGNQAVFSSGNSTAGNLTVGNSTASGANTSLTISNGGNLTVGVVYLGFGAGATGSMVVTDPQTALISNQHTTGGESGLGISYAPGLEIGANGTGSLTIANGATLQSDYSTYVGFGIGSNGTLIVTGDGSTLYPGRSLNVGYLGTGNVVIEDGGVVRYSVEDLFIGGNNTTVTVTGTAASGNASTITLGGEINFEGQNDSLTIANGGQIPVSVLVLLTGNSCTLTVTDSGSFLAAGTLGPLANGLEIDNGSSLIIANGASLTSNSAEIGLSPSTSSSATVTGDGSVWNAINNLVVGNTGTGSLTLANGGAVNGTIVLAQNSTSNGTLNLNSGSLIQVGLNSGLVIGSGNATINWDGGTMQATSNLTLNASMTMIGVGGIFDTNGNDCTFTGNLSGTGNFTKNGDGNLTLTVNNPPNLGPQFYTGPTTINGGTLIISERTTAGGAVASNITDNANLTFSAFFGIPGVPTASNLYGIYSGVLSGNGTVTIQFPGAVMASTNTFTGNIQIGGEAGLTFDGDTSQMGGSININSGTLTFAQNFDTSYAGNITLNGDLVKAGSGNLTLSENIVLPSFSQISVSTGNLIFTGNISQTGNFASISTGIGANIVYQQAFDSTFTLYPFHGNLVQAGTATLTIGSGDFPDGTTTINSGTLVITGNTLILYGNIVDNSALVFANSGDIVCCPNISGSGSVTLNGNGTTTLSGFANTYTGNTTINSGTLNVEFQLSAASNVTVNSGGTLSGGSPYIGSSGVRGFIVVNAGGTLSPGGLSVGTLIVNNVSLNPGATTVFSLTDPGNYTQLSVAGTLAEAGNVVLNLSNNLYAGSYQLLSGNGSLTNDFGNVTLAGLYAAALTDSGGVWSGTISGANFSFSAATGQLVVTGSIPPETAPTKAAWLQEYFTVPQLTENSVSGDYANPSGDGIPNLIKYAFDLSPWEDGHAALPQPVASDGELVLTFPTPPADLIFTVEASTDLVTWGASGVDVQNSGGQVTATYPLPDSGVAFLHVVVGPAP
jgi:fibronectin-binding autotransporter adhesin